MQATLDHRSNDAAISRSAANAPIGDTRLAGTNGYPHSLHVLIVDCDENSRTDLEVLFSSVGIPATGFSSAADLLEAEDLHKAGCIVTEVRLPKLSGLHLQTALANRSEQLPIVFLTKHGDIPMAVAAIKAGAVDFLTKPARDQTVLDSVMLALDIGAKRRARAQSVKLHIDRLGELTKRELQVLCEVVQGRLNKQIAFDLGISEVTVKLHRCSVMRKMRVTSVAELVRAWEALPAELRPSGDATFPGGRNVARSHSK